MSNWIDIPAHRILCVPYSEYQRDFDLLDANGQPAGFDAVPYSIFRKRDSRRFMPADFYPHLETAQAAMSGETVICLKEC